MSAAVRLQGVTKLFGAVRALDGVGFELAPREIHGLLGENGAGKTTLARVVAGLLTPDAGRVEIGGRTVRLGSAAEARALGVAMVHQHFSLVPRFTGFENVVLFNAEAWATRGGVRQDYRKRIEARADELRLPVELDVPVERMGVADRQRIEILKALMGETGVLLLDEPTAVLAPQEVEGLFAVLRRVAAAGAGIVLVAHKLDEVLAAADRVTVLRRGRWVMTREAAEVTARELADAMVGVGGVGGEVRDVPARRVGGEVRDVPARRVGGEARDGPARRVVGEAIVAELRDVSAASAAGVGLRGVSLAVRRGEILGIGGVGGNGQRTLAAVLAGLQAPDAGEAVLPDEAGWIPQERDGEGLVNGFTIAENVALALHAQGSCRRGPWLDWEEVDRAAAALVGEMDVRTGAPGVAAGTLSGGNQQKMVAGREFLRSGELLVAESPTRGLDVKATVAVRGRIRTLAKDGGDAPGIVLISTDLDEILELADRIAVMVRGRLIPVPPEDHNPAAIGELMLGAGSRGADRDPGTEADRGGERHQADVRDRPGPGETAG